MRDILSDLSRWIAEQRVIALATVVRTWGSSPRPQGATMAITADGKFIGSVSGGCVENAVIEAGIDSLKTNQARLLHFGVADETAWEVGLACGGTIDIFVKPLNLELFQSLRSALLEDSPAVVVTVIRGPQELLARELLVREEGAVTEGFGGGWNKQVLKLADEALREGTSRSARLNETLEVFLNVMIPPPTLIAVGAVHIAMALVPMAKGLGYRTVVIDPRRAWGSSERFPTVDQLIQEWPEEAFQEVKLTRSSAVVMLTHDPKLDDPALRIALASSAFYVGALGSKTTQAKRRERLMREGMDEAQIALLHAPIGLEIGAATPEEIALAIMAQIVQTQRTKTALTSPPEARPSTSL